jgi:hypothetical protein
MKHLVKALGRASCWARPYAAFALCATTAIALSAQTFTTLHSFNGAGGENPYAKIPTGRWFRRPTGTCTGRRESVGRTATERSSK